MINFEFMFYSESSYKEKPIYDLKAHQDSSNEVKLLLKVIIEKKK